MELRKKIVKLKNVTQIPYYDSFITRDGDKLITREGDFITWVRILSAYATDINYDGTTFSFIEHYRLSNGEEAATLKAYNRFSPTVSITSASTSEIISNNPTAWTSVVRSVIDLGEGLYEEYEGWSLYTKKHNIAAEYNNDNNTYYITAQAETASHIEYRDNFLQLSINAAVPTFNTSIAQEYDSSEQRYDTYFNVSTVSGSLSAMAQHHVAVYNSVYISDFPTEWGKLLNVQHTTTITEMSGSWVYIVALTFENKFLPIRVSRNGAVTVDINSATSYNQNLNSAVYSNGQWISAIAEDRQAYMIWSDQYGTPKRSLNYVTATAIGWNDGHNTVQNFATSSSISDGTITIKFWGNPIASYKVLT